MANGTEDLKYTTPAWLEKAFKEGAMADVLEREARGAKEPRVKARLRDLFKKLMESKTSGAKFRTMETRTRGGEKQLRDLEEEGY